MYHSFLIRSSADGHLGCFHVLTIVNCAKADEIYSLKYKHQHRKDIVSVQFSSVAQSCPTLCDPMNRSTPGLPVHHQLPEFTQTHVH